MRQLINIAGKLFKTKKDLKAYTRALVDSDSFNGTDPFWFALIERHPEKEKKIGVGISHFVKEPNTWRTDYVTKIVRTDNSIVDFSWVKCVSGIQKTDTAKLLSAMRLAVTDQVKAFKANNFPLCKACGTQENLEVDHVVTFDSLAKIFMSEWTSMPNEFDDCSDSFRAKFKKEDSFIEKAWVRFHAEESELQLLCVTCHKEKSKVKNV